MLPKDFENFELRLKTLREESKESVERAETLFEEKYAPQLKNVFPRDILWAKKYIAGSFIIAYNDISLWGEEPNISDIFQKSVEKVVAILPMSLERKKSLSRHILELWENSVTLDQYFKRTDDISRDPFFALVEDFALDGDISREEFLLLEESYSKSWNFLWALEALPVDMRELFGRHLTKLLWGDMWERQKAFEAEYHKELQWYAKQGFNMWPFIRFVSRSYYKTPGKLRKNEHPQRRLRRTMKMALLRLLRLKLGNVDAERILEQFESGEIFEDFFKLLYKLLEVLDENPWSKEVFTLFETVEETEAEVMSAEQTREKILAWDRLTANISWLVGRLDGELEEGVLSKILEDDTHFHGDEVQFWHGEDMAWVYAKTTEVQQDEEEEDLLIDEWDTLEGNYERLKDYFHEVDDKKRKAFALWDYEAIDEYNDELIILESKIEKIAKLIGKEDIS